MSDFGLPVGEWIAARLADTRMTVSELAKASKVARSTIDKIIDGGPIEPRTYEKLAPVLSPSPPPLRQVVGGPRILSDATTTRQALSMARRAIEAAGRLLTDEEKGRATSPPTDPREDARKGVPPKSPLPDDSPVGPRPEPPRGTGGGGRQNTGRAPTEEESDDEDEQAEG